MAYLKIEASVVPANVYLTFSGAGAMKAHEGSSERACEAVSGSVCGLHQEGQKQSQKQACASLHCEGCASFPIPREHPGYPC